MSMISTVVLTTFDGLDNSRNGIQPGIRHLDLADVDLSRCLGIAQPAF
jgi:hypothetical protein